MQNISNLQRRREMFRLADRLRFKLTSPHHPLTYNEHSMLRPGTYWQWSILFDLANPKPYAALGEVEHLLTELYPHRTVMMVLSMGGAEIFVATKGEDEAALADGKADSHIPWARSWGE